MNKRLLFHPVFNLQPWNTTEMFHIACHDNEVFFKCCCSNERIHIANLLSLITKCQTLCDVGYPFASDEARQECLFKLYEKMTVKK